MKLHSARRSGQFVMCADVPHTFIRYLDTHIEFAVKF